MPSKSAGIVAFRRRHGTIEVLLVHPGGPFWRNKDLGAWSIPKGEYGAGEAPENVARREFAEELGIEMDRELLELGEIRQRGGKIVTAFATEADVDVANIRSNTFEIEWPPRSGKRQAFPEVDRAEWFELNSARLKINEGQKALLDRLETISGRKQERPVFRSPN
jgi:predicted NUDIX family NTP pyrophosphohydrolase